MSIWPLRKINDIASFLNSRRVPVKAADRAKRQGEFPYYGASGIVDYVDGYLFDGKYLLISEDGENLRSRNTPIAFIAKGKFWVNNHAHILDEKEPGVLEHLARALNNTDLSPYITGAAQPKLNKRTLADIEVPVPPIEDRLAINAILGALDDKIELNRKTTAILEEMARALYRSWFVDFDPVWAKNEGRIPAQMDAVMAALFPDGFGDDGLPLGWRQQGLDDIADFLNGLALQKFPAVEGEDALPVIKIAELRNGIGSNTGKAALSVPSKYHIVDGDILFSWSGSLLQKVWTGGAGALNQHLFKVSSSVVPKWFHYFAVDQHLAEFQMIAASKATTMGHIQRHHLSEALVTVPTQEVLEAADKIIGPLFEAAFRRAMENQTLAELRDALLPKLLSGELRVGEARERVEEVA